MELLSLDAASVAMRQGWLENLNQITTSTTGAAARVDIMQPAYPPLLAMQTPGIQVVIHRLQGYEKK
jgi:hypothetical protein